MVGYAWRDKGDWPQASKAFVLGAQRAPADPNVRLDAADVFAVMGDWSSAADWATRAWELVPELGKAAARACYAAWRRTGQGEHLEDLFSWLEARVDTKPDGSWQALGDLGDAIAIAGAAAKEAPWPVGLPYPANAAVNVAKQAQARNVEGGHAAAKVRFSPPESPSPLIALERVVGKLEVVTTSVPDPDPRLPRRPVKVLTWQLRGDRLVPGLPAPTEAEIEQVRPSQLPWYGRGQVRKDALPLAASGLRDQAIASLALYPRAGPAGITPWDWVRRWQYVCCFALAQRGTLDTLADISDGPEDWLADAALAGLIEIALREPALTARVLDIVGEHIYESTRRLATLDLPHFGVECTVILSFPGLPEKARTAVRAKLDAWTSATGSS